MDELISSVLANFQEISAMEGVINVPANGEMNTSQKERVESSMQMITEKLKANKEDIDRLNAKLQALGSKNSRNEQRQLRLCKANWSLKRKRSAALPKSCSARILP